MKTAKFMKYSVVVKARNEQKDIEKTLLALKRQSIKPSQIIVVDDGSTDHTGEIARKYAEIVVTLPYHTESFVGRPQLARVVNAGLEKVKDDVDYVVICDADHVLPENYLEAIVKKMKANPKLVIASGSVKGEPYFESHPRGSGRVVDSKFWRVVNGLLYPVVWGWEDWLCFKAMQLGYEVRSFKDIVTELQRPTRLGSVGGKKMYALGYDWKYALGRCVLTFLKSPEAGWSMFWGWLLHENVERLDIADWVNHMQKELFWKRVQAIIKRGGRK